MNRHLCILTLAPSLFLSQGDVFSATATNQSVTSDRKPVGELVSTNTNKVQAAAPAANTPSVTNAVVALSFESFKLISDRNIFNQNRSPRSRGSSAGTNDVKKAVQVESISLGGTMSYSKGFVAFFVSSSPEYRKSLKTGESIAGYSIKTIELDHVDLEKGGTNMTLKVGNSLRREDGGPWQLSGRVDPPPQQAAASAADGADDVLQRLLRKREKEMNQ